MTKIKQKIMEVLSGFEDTNLASEAAREIIADKLMVYIKENAEIMSEDEYKDEMNAIGDALRQQGDEF